MKKLINFSLLLLSLQAVAQDHEPAIDSAQVANIVLDSLNLVQVPTDSAAIANELKEKASKALADSLNNYVDLPVQLDSMLSDQAKQEAKNRLEQELGINIPIDSATLAKKAESLASQAIKDQTSIEVDGIPTDSAAVKHEAKNLLKSEFADQAGLDAPDITLDSTTATQVKEEAAKRAEVALKETDHMKALEGSDGELGKLVDTKEQVEKTVAEIREMKARKELKQKMAGHAKEFIQENAEQIQQVQSKMGELKQKYSSVVNSNDLSTATKRTSLKGEPFWKRLVIGGNLNVSETDPLSIDFSPVIGWKLNKLFEAGITGAYRAKFGADKIGVNTYKNEKVYGFSVFANHMMYKNFFGYIEGENLSTVSGTTESSERTWKQSLLVGIGRKFRISKFLEMQAIVSYNFLHDNSEGAYNSPVVFKTGFRVVK